MTEEINYGLADSLMGIFGYERVGKMTATIWTNEDCENCKEVKEKLMDKGYTIEERDANELIKGHVRNIDALAQLASQNMSLPIVLIDGEFIEFENL
jgi:glutaredoxin